MACYRELLGCKAFWEVLQGGGEPVLPVFGKVADICQQTDEQHLYRFILNSELNNESKIFSLFLYH